MTRKRGEGGKAGMRHAMGSTTLEFIDRILCVGEVHCMARALGLPEGERLAVRVRMKVTLVGGKSRRPLGSLRRPGLNSVIGSSYPDVTLRLFPIYMSLYIPIQNLLTLRVILSG